MACAIRDEGVPSSCIVNADQTQVVYSHRSQYTWNEWGVHQVQVVGTEEKCAYMMLVGVSNDGSVLPFQAIYQGKTSASLPHPKLSARYDKALTIGMQFLPSFTDTYWSTLETMKTYVTNLLVPYFRAEQTKHGLPTNQHCIFQIDAWLVHRSDKFWLWMEENFPWIGLHYIPGRCTGLFQACDVALQWVAKIAMCRKALSDMIEETTEALASGADPITFINNKTVKTLRNWSVSWMVDAYNTINKPELVKKANFMYSICFTILNQVC